MELQDKDKQKAINELVEIALDSYLQGFNDAIGTLVGVSKEMNLEKMKKAFLKRLSDKAGIKIE